MPAGAMYGTVLVNVRKGDLSHSPHVYAGPHASVKNISKIQHEKLKGMLSWSYVNP